MPFQMLAFFFFLIQCCWGLLLGLNHVNSSLPKRSQQLMTWFTFHLENCSDWKALSRQESTIVPSVWARSWTLLLPYPECDTGPSWPGYWVVCLKLPANGKEQGVSWAGALVAPPGPAQSCSCSSRLLLLMSPACCPSVVVGLASKCDCTLCHKLCMTKTMLDCSTGNFYYPAYQDIMVLWSCFHFVTKC